MCIIQKQPKRSLEEKIQEMKDIVKASKKSKGSAVVWLHILIGIFVIALCYLIFSQVIYVHVKPTVISMLGNSTSNTTDVINTINMIDMVWQVWPLILIFGLLLYGVVKSQQREPSEYVY